MIITMAEETLLQDLHIFKYLHTAEHTIYFIGITKICGREIKKYINILTYEIEDPQNLIYDSVYC